MTDTAVLSRSVPGDGDRDAFVEAIAARVDALTTPDEAPGVADFVRAYLAQVALDDLRERGADHLLAAGRAHWSLAHRRTPGTPVLRVYTPSLERDGWESDHTIVEIVNDDMPFLVDSVTMEIDRQGLGVHLVVHPIIRVRRDRTGALQGLAGDGTTVAASDEVAESYIHVEVDRTTNSATLEDLDAGLRRVLADVQAATSDWRAMLDTLAEVIAQVDRRPPPIDEFELGEARAFLSWIADEHFTFLGYRRYDLAVDDDGVDTLQAVPGSGLGILRRAPGGRSESFRDLPPEVRAKAREPHLLVLTKANRRSTVHRPTYLDYVGVKRFDADGNIVGEDRFLGLYTSAAYNSNPVEIPLLRTKIAAVLRRAGFPPASHAQKDLVVILETYPRDELFQISDDELLETSLGILHLHERRRVRLFVRREPYRRFVSCLVFLPRDRYTTVLRERIASLLTNAFGAVGHEWDARVSESILARLHFVLHVDPHDDRTVEVAALERLIALATRLWTDDLRDALVADHGEERGLERFRRYSAAFPVGFRDDFAAAEALPDIAQLERLHDGTELVVRLWSELDGRLGCKIYGTGAPPALAAVLPRLANLGLSALEEHPYVVQPAGLETRWMSWFRIAALPGVDVRAVGPLFEEALAAILRGDAEDDAFNRLVLAAGLPVRDVAIVRAYCRYLRQAGSPHSQTYMAGALAAHPALARALVGLFVARFDPALATTGREQRTAAISARILEGLDAVESLDEDRILRALHALVEATLRTNFFCTPVDPTVRHAFAIKLDPARVPDLPAPRPMFEIFVHAPTVEGVHLRAGRVARGGIRWSDRREDYRTEVLGLMKAQRVKNALIVPAGAKGGFVVKQPPVDRDALAAEVVACYRAFVSALLDVTDNLVEGAVVPPPDVVRHDGDDPYLVVAADKGTATFSDIANQISTSRGFWLGDAFASGGSVGYDHKAMGITACGAWESVKRHFRELGVDVQTTNFTAVGIGDMSGDVFGNGMLCSPRTRLVAAFDHRHVFLDPDPDPAASFEERRRLFARPRSSWADYDPSKLSPGGGVFARTLKSIPVTPEVRRVLGLPHGTDALPPHDLIRAILRAPVDLLWNGGIGTYVKARSETHAEVGDKANDPVRVDGADLRCRVVGEGGNLGFTQPARVEFALAGGRICTDAIDNSAGVDTSDREVNIKILLAGAVRAGELDATSRSDLLAEMTDEVAALVLRDNYRQNRALANTRAQAGVMGDVYARYMRALEHHGQLDRALERLPDDETLADRANTGAGLTEPEYAVLLAYTKITLDESLLGSALVDDPDLLPVLLEYFPRPARERCAAYVASHPLRREILATTLANEVVNRGGITMVYRLAGETGAAPADIVRSHHVASELYRLPALWAEVSALDGAVAAEIQQEMYLESRKIVERATRWLLRRLRRDFPIAATIERYGPPMAELASTLPDLLLGSERAWIDHETAHLREHGVPELLAHRVAGLDSLAMGLDIADLAAARDLPLARVAAVQCVAGDRLQLDWLRDRVVDLPREDRWQELSRLALREDSYDQHRAITADILDTAPGEPDASTAFDRWAGENPAAIDRVRGMLDELRAHGVFDMATLSVALRELRALTQSAR